MGTCCPLDVGGTEDHRGTLSTPSLHQKSKDHVATVLVYLAKLKWSLVVEMVSVVLVANDVFLFSLILHLAHIHKLPNCMICITICPGTFLGYLFGRSPSNVAWLSIGRAGWGWYICMYLDLKRVLVNYCATSIGQNSRWCCGGDTLELDCGWMTKHMCVQVPSAVAWGGRYFMFRLNWVNATFPAISPIFLTLPLTPTLANS